MTFEHLGRITSLNFDDHHEYIVRNHDIESALTHIDQSFRHAVFWWYRTITIRFSPSSLSSSPWSSNRSFAWTFTGERIMSLLQYQNLQIPEFRFHLLARLGLAAWYMCLTCLPIQAYYSAQEYFAEKKREEEKWKARERAGFGWHRSVDVEEYGQYRLWMKVLIGGWNYPPWWLQDAEAVCN